MHQFFDIKLITALYFPCRFVQIVPTSSNGLKGHPQNFVETVIPAGNFR
jgi:hypothetical protein